MHDNHDEDKTDTITRAEYTTRAAQGRAWHVHTLDDAHREVFGEYAHDWDGDYWHAVNGLPAPLNVRD